MRERCYICYMKFSRAVAYVSAGLALLVPALASAHEVYVLDPATVAAAMASPSQNPFDAIRGNEFNFIFWCIVTFVAFSTVLAASAFRVFERRFDPFLFSLKKYALPIVRISVGLCFVAFSFSGNLYG